MQRTKLFALQIIKLSDKIPNKPSGWVISKQICRSGTSIGANYRASQRAISSADFIYKLKIVEEECDETIYWLGLLLISKTIEPDNVNHLIRDCSLEYL